MTRRGWSALKGVTGPQWFRTTTQRIDAMHLIERELLADPDQYVANGTATATTAMVVLGTQVALLLGAGVVGLVMVMRVGRDIGAVAAVTGRLADGDLAVEVSADRRTDEIGRLTAALRIFRDRLAEAARADARLAGERERTEGKAGAATRTIDAVEHSASETGAASLSLVNASRTLSADRSALAAEIERFAQSVRSA